MDRNRLLLAFVLMLMVAIAPSLIWPPKKPAAGRLRGSADSVALRDSAARSVRPSQPTAPPSTRSTAESADTGRIVLVTSPLYRLGFSTRGGLLRSAELLQYQSFAPGDSARPVQLVPKGDAFLRHRLVLPTGDTVSLDDWDFQPSPDALGLVVHAGQAATPLRFDAERRGSHVTLEYSFVPDEYRFEVHGSVTGLGSGGAVLLIDLASGLRSVERDSLDDYRHYSVVTKASKTERTDFSSIRPDQRALLNGPFEWVGVKSKYFLTAALALEEGQPTFGGAIAIGGPRIGKAASRATILITMPVPAAGTFRYSVYAGPLDYRQLGRMGHGLDDANPYGGIFRPIVRPVSVFVTSILLWMHGQLHLAYGWALILFGIVVRLLLWPLNQKRWSRGFGCRRWRRCSRKHRRSTRTIRSGCSAKCCASTRTTRSIRSAAACRCCCPGRCCSRCSSSSRTRSFSGACRSSGFPICRAPIRSRSFPSCWVCRCSGCPRLGRSGCRPIRRPR